jgi:hypothetical protein
MMPALAQEPGVTNRCTFIQQFPRLNEAVCITQHSNGSSERLFDLCMLMILSIDSIFSIGGI